MIELELDKNLRDYYSSFDCIYFLQIAQSVPIFFSTCRVNLSLNYCDYCRNSVSYNIYIKKLVPHPQLLYNVVWMFNII